MEDSRTKWALEQLKYSSLKTGAPQYDLSQYETVQINIRIQNDVPTGLFKPDPMITGGWIANTQTFRAMNKNIFTGTEIFDDLLLPIPCPGCAKKLDWQYWVHCPHCEFKLKL